VVGEIANTVDDRQRRFGHVRRGDPDGGPEVARGAILVGQVEDALGRVRSASDVIVDDRDVDAAIVVNRDRRVGPPEAGSTRLQESLHRPRAVAVGHVPQVATHRCAGVPLLVGRDGLLTGGDVAMTLRVERDRERAEVAGRHKLGR